MADPKGLRAEIGLEPGPSPSKQPERRQMTPAAYVSVGARHPAPQHPTPTRPRLQHADPTTGADAPTHDKPLDTANSQLGHNVLVASTMGRRQVVSVSPPLLDAAAHRGPPSTANSSSTPRAATIDGPET